MNATAKRKKKVAKKTATKKASRNSVTNVLHPADAGVLSTIACEAVPRSDILGAFKKHTGFQIREGTLPAVILRLQRSKLLETKKQKKGGRKVNLHITSAGIRRLDVSSNYYDRIT